MILRNLCLLTAMMLACAGCAESVWRHPAHQDQGRLDADTRLCDDLAQQAVPFSGLHWTHHQARVHDAFMVCMHHLGYHRESAGTPATTR